MRIVGTSLLRGTLLICLLIGLPLLGILWAGKPVAQFLEFPPLTRYVEHAPFSWLAFSVLSLLLLSMILPFVWVSLGSRRPLRLYFVQSRPFPWWGWVAVGCLAVSWVLAWTRFTWFGALQPFTFTPLWLSYIGIINALTSMRTGHCMMVNRPGFFLALFPLSAAFWWFFEYLNRFVQNWHYIGVEEFTAIEYVIHATLPFSTVLPAVLSTVECLESFPRLDRAFRDLWPMPVLEGRLIGWLVLTVAGAGLMGIGIWPDYLFPLLWVSPLLIIVSTQLVSGEDTFLARLGEGDWRAVCLPALAGLVCGFFWEMWNSRSLAHWEYMVPFFHQFEIFEMPLLGYAGYLPFGLECLVVGHLLPVLKARSGLVT